MRHGCWGIDAIVGDIHGYVCRQDTFSTVLSTSNEDVTITTDRVESVVAASAVQRWINVEFDLGTTTTLSHLFQVVHRANE